MKINFSSNNSGFNPKKVEIQEVFQQIKKGDYKNEIVALRNKRQIGYNKEADAIKNRLPVFTVSATYNTRRKPEYIESYTNLLHLDYDKVEDVENLKIQVESIPYTYAAFISPSGNGLKVFIKSNNEQAQHEDAFYKIRDYYDTNVNVSSDATIKDKLRLCYVSHDPNLYLNESSETFDYYSFLQNKIRDIWNSVSNSGDFIPGNRNNYVYKFACNCNRIGIAIYDAIDYAHNYVDEDFDRNEIETTIRSAYENNLNEHATNRQVAKPAISAKSNENPLIPEGIYDELPEILRDACNEFTGRKRDVFLTSSLSIISGGFYNAYGNYDGQKVYPNLFSFIIAPPASGKGSMKYAQKLGVCYHNFLLNERKERILKYKKQKHLYDMKLRKAKSDAELEGLKEPEKPKVRLFYIPADTSSSMLVKHLEDNDGMGCISETEADTMSKALNQDWGGYSDILRKGFHSESISKSRITDLNFSEIKEPKFSVAITGTPNQLDTLISSIQDGLFSRFLFYTFKSKSKWRSTFTDIDQLSHDYIFTEYSTLLCDKFKVNKEIQFSMTPEQGKELDRVFTEILNHNSALYDDVVSGIIFRLGLITFKIAMTLSLLRSDEPHIVCSDQDFRTSLRLVTEVYLNHSIYLLNKIGKQSNKLNEVQKELLSWMKNQDRELVRKELLSKAQSLDIKDRTLSDILKKFIKLNLIKKVSHGLYACR